MSFKILTSRLWQWKKKVDTSWCGAELAKTKCQEQLLSEGYDGLLLQRALTTMTYVDLPMAIYITNS